MQKIFLHPGVNYTELVSSGRMKAPGVDFTSEEREEIKNGRDFKEIQADFADARDAARIKVRAAAKREQEAKKTTTNSGGDIGGAIEIESMKRGELFGACKELGIEVSGNAANQFLIDAIKSHKATTIETDAVIETTTIETDAVINTTANTNEN